LLDIEAFMASQTCGMTVAETIRTKLEAAFTPVHLSVNDESSRHAGHAGAREGGETHFHVSVVSSMFQGVARVERQRQVHQVLDAELKGRVHALSLTLMTPEEASRRL
jgi:BolA protein